MVTNVISSKTILQNERIISLDLIRGFAVLGILLMNIQSFSMIGQAYLNPMAYGDMNGANKWGWIICHVMADQKFMSIFSMLFGASIIMISRKAEIKYGSSINIHYQRNFWLLIIGLFHAYFLWYGDILTPYAVCAMLIYPLKQLSSRKLLLLGILVFSIGSFIEIVIGLSIADQPIDALFGEMAGWQPDKRIIDFEIEGYLGSFMDQMHQRSKTAVMMHTKMFMSFYFWRISGLMLIGMALFKSGFLSGRLNSKLYKRVLIYGGTLGLILVIIGVISNFNAGWSITYSKYFGAQFNYWGSLPMALSYISFLILLLHSGKLKIVMHLLSTTGRMALSNYLIQTILCTFIFYGIGLGLFGQIERVYQLLIVLFIWGIQVVISSVWLKYFKMGLFEWVWRSLTYFKIQPLKK